MTISLPNDLALLNVRSRIMPDKYVPRANTSWLALLVKQTHFPYKEAKIKVFIHWIYK